MENKLNSKGKREGLWIFKGPTGKKLYEANYKNGIKDGQEICYFNNNNRKESIAHFKNGKLNGPYVSFFNKAGSPIESKGEHLNGKMHGEWIAKTDYFDPYNKGTYVNGEKHGHWIESSIYPWRGVYLNGKKEGCWIQIGGLIDLPTKGPIREICYYKAGQIDGLHITFYGDGKIHFYHEYVNGKKNGKWFRYLQNGQISEGGNFKNDKKEGEWIEDFDAGSFVKRNYKNGKQIQ